MEHGPDFLLAELNWLADLLRAKQHQNAHPEGEGPTVFDVLPVNPADYTSAYATWVRDHQLKFEERLLLALALAPHAQPALLDTFLSVNGPIPTAFGGKTGTSFRGFIPSAETFFFLLAEGNWEVREGLLTYFDREHLFGREKVLTLATVSEAEPEWSGALCLSPEFVDLFLRGTIRKPDLSPDFPAKLLTTDLEWDDLILSGHTHQEFQNIEIWSRWNGELATDSVFGKRQKPGYRALFSGPPGTGKTLSACLLGKRIGADVYRIDLSTLVSKYIGETEKNLANLFDRAETKHWVLFFDEADAIFGKRTGVSDSHDRYANQEVSYLLQKIEYYPGLIILATNMQNNLDHAFLRRFQSIIQFSKPSFRERRLLWSSSLPAYFTDTEEEDIDSLIKQYELTGSQLTNILSWCYYQSREQNTTTLKTALVRRAIAREFGKEGRTL